jgi:hypothetical protein
MLVETGLAPSHSAAGDAASLVSIGNRAASIEIGATQIEAAFAANHLAAESAQLGRAVGTDRGYILLRIRRGEARKNATRSFGGLRRN